MSDIKGSDVSLFSMLSHEFRTPMNGIVGYVQLLRGTPLAGIQILYVDELMTCCASLVKLINDLLDFKKLEGNRLEANASCLDVSELMREVFTATKPHLDSKLQRLYTKLGPQIPQYVQSDRSKLLQVLVNLVTNASKASAKKETIILDVGYDQNNLIFKIIDTGPGVPEDKRGRVFDPFYQIEKHDYSSGGAGLGLAISKKMAALLKGTISIENNSPGCTFTFSVPCSEAELHAIESLKGSKMLEGVEVLVVDDEKANRMELSKYLHQWKMRPVICASPLEALTTIISHRYNFRAALLDICMPQTSGDELARHILDVQGSLPLIAMSSADSFDASMFSACIFKPPLDPAQLFAALVKVIRPLDSPAALETCSTNEAHSTKLAIVEDNFYNKRVLVELLRLAGYTNTSSFSKCDDAWEAIQKEQPQFLFLDLRMESGPDGFWLLEKMRNKFSSRFVNERVVVMSACLNPMSKNKCSYYGVQHLLEKPVLLQDVLKIIKR